MGFGSWKLNWGFEVLVLVVGVVPIFLAFPDGAPNQSCIRHKPNHGGKAQPISQMPFTVTATSSTYNPGDTVAVRIASKWGKYFKGFFVQASDERGRWIGEFTPTDFSVSHPECSATTHHDNLEKEDLVLIWNAPKNSSGTVRFLASILKDYKLYWVDAPALTPNKSKAALAEASEQETETEVEEKGN